MPTPPTSSAARRADIDLLVLDVDGVLTDGTLYYGESGEVLKAFHARDGLGLRLLRNEGIEVAVVTARAAPALVRRLADLGITHAMLGCDDKRAGLMALARTTGIAVDRTAYVGDDVLDLPALRAVGLPIAVSDAHPLVLAEAAWVTEAAGGRGAVREVCDALLDTRGRLAAACEDLFAHHLRKGEHEKL